MIIKFTKDKALFCIKLCSSSTSLEKKRKKKKKLYPLTHVLSNSLLESYTTGNYSFYTKWETQGSYWGRGSQATELEVAQFKLEPGFLDS